MPDVSVSIPLNIRSELRVAEPVAPVPIVKSSSNPPPAEKRSIPERLLPVLMVKSDEEDPVIVPVPEADRSAPVPKVSAWPPSDSVPVVRVRVPFKVRSEPSIAEPEPPRSIVTSSSMAPLPVAKRNPPVRLPPVVSIRSDDDEPVRVPVPEAEISAPASKVSVWPLMCRVPEVKVSIPLSVRSVPSITEPVLPVPMDRSSRMLPPAEKRKAPVRLLPPLIIRSDEEEPVSVPEPVAEKSAPVPSVSV